MKPLGVIVRGLTVLWLRGPMPARVDAEWITFLWQKGRTELRSGTQKYEASFEEFVAGMRKLALEGGQPGRADWVIMLQDPPPYLLGALVGAALKHHWRELDRAPRTAAAFSQREIYPELTAQRQRQSLVLEGR